MLNPARKYLTLRALGSPAVLLSLAMQGVFRGFKDTKTPLYATGERHFVLVSAFFSSIPTFHKQCLSAQQIHSIFLTNVKSNIYIKHTHL